MINRWLKKEKENENNKVQVEKFHWMSDEQCVDCFNCHQPFTPIRRKHHCRQCGRVFCGNCSSYRVNSINLYMYTKFENKRLCEYCYNLLQYKMNRKEILKKLENDDPRLKQIIKIELTKEEEGYIKNKINLILQENEKYFKENKIIIKNMINMALEIIKKIIPGKLYSDLLDIRQYVKLVYITTTDIMDQNFKNLYYGVIFKCCVLNNLLNYEIKNPSILIFGCRINYERTKSYLLLDSVVKQQNEYLNILINRILKINPDIIITRYSVSKLFQQALEKHKKIILTNVNISRLKAIAKCTNANILTSTDDIGFANLGKAKTLTLKQYYDSNIPITVAILESFNTDLYVSTLIFYNDSNQTTNICKTFFSILFYMKHNLDELMFLKSFISSFNIENFTIVNKKHNLDFKHTKSLSDSNKDLIKDEITEFQNCNDLLKYKMNSLQFTNNILSISLFYNINIPISLMLKNKLNIDSRVVHKFSFKNNLINNDKIELELTNSCFNIDTLFSKIELNNENEIFQNFNNNISNNLTIFKAVGYYPNIKKVFFDQNLSKNQLINVSKMSNNTTCLENTKKDFLQQTIYNSNLYNFSINLFTEILVLYYCFSIQSKIFPSFCIYPCIRQLKYYSTNDIKLNTFLHEHCFKSTTLCNVVGCDKQLNLHTFFYVFNDTKITLMLSKKENNKLIQAFKNNTLYTYIKCIKCQKKSLFKKMSIESMNIPLSLYLNLIINTKKQILKQFCNNHNQDLNFVIYFQYNKNLTKFKINTISLYNIKFFPFLISRIPGFETLIKEIKFFHNKYKTSLSKIIDKFDDNKQTILNFINIKEKSDKIIFQISNFINEMEILKNQIINKIKDGYFEISENYIDDAQNNLINFNLEINKMINKFKLKYAIFYVDLIDKIKLSQEVICALGFSKYDNTNISYIDKQNTFNNIKFHNFETLNMYFEQQQNCHNNVDSKSLNIQDLQHNIKPRSLSLPCLNNFDNFKLYNENKLINLNSEKTDYDFENQNLRNFKNPFKKKVNVKFDNFFNNISPLSKLTKISKLSKINNKQNSSQNDTFLFQIGDPGKIISTALQM